MTHTIELQNITKSFGSKEVLKGLDLAVPQGEVVTLLGTNGAGKTTAISLMLNLIKPTSGRIKVFGLEPKERELRQRIGVLMQEVTPPDGLRVGEILQLFRSYYRNPLPYRSLLDLAGLQKEEKLRATALSGGQRRRLAFAQCLAGNPDLLILDEPTVGMDVESRSRFWEIIRVLAADGRTILLTTHHLEEADAVSDRIAVLADGRLAAEGSPSELKAQLSIRTVTFVSPADLTLDQLKALPGVERAEKLSCNQYRLYAQDTDSILTRLLQTDWSVSQLEIQGASLEAAFIQIVNTTTTKGESA